MGELFTNKPFVQESSLRATLTLADIPLSVKVTDTMQFTTLQKSLPLRGTSKSSNGLQDMASSDLRAFLLPLSDHWTLPFASVTVAQIILVLIYLPSSENNIAFQKWAEEYVLQAMASKVWCPDPQTYGIIP